MHDFDPLKPGGVFKNPVYWHRDEVSGEKIKGKNPNIWVKLRNYRTNKTLFTDLNGQVIDWKLLTDVNITMLPLLHFEKIYVGAKASIQVYLASAIILKIVPINTESRQVSTMEKLRTKYGNLQDQVESQLAELRMSRQDSLNTTPLPSSHTEFGNDYSDNNSTRNTATMHTMPTMSVETAQPVSLQDFLGAPPVMQMPQQTMSQQTMSQQTGPRLAVQHPTMKIN